MTELDKIIVDRSLLTTSDSNMPPDLLEARLSLEEHYRVLLDKVENINQLKGDKVELTKLLSFAKLGVSFYDGVQANAKRNANSLYGYIGASFSRYYKKCVASDITAEGRGAIKMLEVRTTQYLASEKGWVKEIEFFKEMKLKYPNLILVDELKTVHYTNTSVIYGDTDSLFFVLKPILDSLGVPEKGNTKDICDLCIDIIKNPIDRIHKELLRRYAENRNCTNIQVFELEAIMRRTIHLAKKKYVGSYLWKDGKYIASLLKLKVTGLELAQKTTPTIVKMYIKKFVYYMLSSKSISDDTYFKMAYTITKKFDDLPIEEYSKSRGLGSYDKYIDIDSHGHYYALKGASKTIKGVNMYNNLVIEHKLEQKYPLISQGARIKFYEIGNGEQFAYPIDDNCEFPFEIAPKPNVRDNLNKLLFAPLSRIMCKVTNADLSLLGSDVLQKSFSIFEK